MAEGVSRGGSVQGTMNEQCKKPGWYHIMRRGAVDTCHAVWADRIVLFRKGILQRSVVRLFLGDEAVGEFPERRVQYWYRSDNING